MVCISFLCSVKLYHADLICVSAFVKCPMHMCDTETRARQRTIESRKRQLALGPCLPSESINFLNQASNFLRPATTMLWQTTIASQTVIITVWVCVCLCVSFAVAILCSPICVCLFLEKDFLMLSLCWHHFKCMFYLFTSRRVSTSQGCFSDDDFFIE